MGTLYSYSNKTKRTYMIDITTYSSDKLTIFDSY